MEYECRIYVCRSNFGGTDKCIRFKNKKEYDEWVGSTQSVGDYSYQPVCTKHDLFDRMILTLRSGKIGITDLPFHNFTRSKKN